ncbi:hypothetical protein ACFORH_06565 [Amycolatopsis roodepoortensis]|uniref:DUF4352 domain-containing protein n=1 Tax=Amycolatopsis roodepoortensis TaxID=700274 RepID=A0ABR9L7K7_9PSEU|nr:hypothetical protein [Amycolatopsis roodepoortensis]MBE1576678.1 hypothetical protein [Amycolatopsis roodepoortensis]
MNPEFIGLTAVAWQGLGTVIALLALIAALTVGLSQVKSAQKLRVEQARPYIVVDLLPGNASEKLIDLVVTNIGKSPAYDLHVIFDPAPVRTNETSKFELKDARILNETTPMFAPGREFRMFFDSAPDRYASDLPMSFKVMTTYRDSSFRRYNETFTVDFDVQRGAMYTQVHSLHDAVKVLKDISKVLGASAIARGPIEVVHEERAVFKDRQAVEHKARLAEFEALEARMVRPVERDEIEPGDDDHSGTPS